VQNGKNCRAIFTILHNLRRASRGANCYIDHVQQSLLYRRFKEVLYFKKLFGFS